MSRKTIVTILALSLALCLGAGAQTPMSGLNPRDAQSMGMGGAFRVFSEGYSSFFGNPAGFVGRGSLTVADLATWAYVKPIPADILDLVSIAQGAMSQADAQTALDRVIASNGLGAGASLGMGWTGGGVGLGFTIVSDAVASGTGYSDAAIVTRNQANAIVGLAWPLEWGPVGFSFGAAVRGFYRLDSDNPWSFADVAGAFLSGAGFNDSLYSQMLEGGYGLALDTGALLTVGPLSAGIVVRDYGYQFYMDKASVGDIVNDLAFPMTGSKTFIMTPTYIVGLGLDLKPGDPVSARVLVEAENPANFVTSVIADPSTAVDLLHIGAELKILDFITIRGGFNKGLASFGTGIHFLLAHIDTAIFTERTDDPANPTRTGLALQAALRF